jgi:hypothetical protein
MAGKAAASNPCAPETLVNAVLSKFAGPNGNSRRLRGRQNMKGRDLHDHIHLPDRAAVSDADELINRYGTYAASEAARRASRSRALGNVVHYCRWRQIERMIDRLAAGSGGETLH